MLESIKDRSSIEEVVERISSEICQPFVAEGQTVPLSASIGASSFPSDGTDIETLFEKADRAMYSAKNARRSQTAQ